MSRYALELATRESDAELRALLAETPMGGNIQISLRREPSYFAAAAVDGFTRETIIARDRERRGKIVGVGARSLRNVYFSGQPRFLGYLSELRLDPRGGPYGSTLPRGFAFLKRLHGDGRAPFYFTTIAEGNARAIETLTGGRCGLPQYRFAGRYHTHAIPIPRRRAASPGKRVDHETRRCCAADLPSIVAFLNSEGRAKNLFPVVAPEDFSNDAGTFRGMHAEDFWVATRHGEIAGAMARWDQRSFKQTVIHGYGAPLRWLRRPYNWFAGLRNQPALPAPGSELRFVMAALPVVRGGDPEVLRLLIEAHLAQLAGSGVDYFLAGMHESDSLLPALLGFHARRYTTILYYVSWDDADPEVKHAAAATPHLELGTL